MRKGSEVLNCCATCTTFNNVTQGDKKMFYFNFIKLWFKKGLNLSACVDRNKEDTITCPILKQTNKNSSQSEIAAVSYKNTF